MPLCCRATNPEMFYSVLLSNDVASVLFLGSGVGMSNAVELVDESGDLTHGQDLQ